MPRRGIAAIAVVGALLISALGNSGLPATAAAAPERAIASAASATPEAVQRFGACLAGGGQGHLLLLIDRSGSLKGTDPKNARVTAAGHLVKQMASLASRSNLTLEIAVAGFDTGYEKVTDWTPVVSGRNALLQSLDRFAARNQGVDTDYWNAMTGARRELAGRGAGKQGRCSAIVLFTDGEYSLTTRGGNHPSIADLGGPKPYDRNNDLSTDANVAAAIGAGEQDICRAGGVADQIRSQDIITFGIGLSSDRKPDFGFLRKMTTGEGGCGKIVQPVSGAFIEAANIRDLFFGFDQIAGGDTPAVVQRGGVCGATACPQGTHSFVLDSSISKIHALADSDADGSSITLVDPAGGRLNLARGASGSGSLPGGKVTWQWLGDASVSVDVERTADTAWTGQWSLRFSAPNPAGKTSRSSLRIFGDLLPKWPASTSTVLRAGEVLKDVTFQLVHVDGSPVDPARLSPRTTLTASLVLADGTSLPVATGLSGSSIAAPQTIDLTGVDPGSATLRLALAVTTKDWASLGRSVPGTVLEPQVNDISVDIRTPANYPSLAKSVDFGTITEAGQVSGSVAVTGKGCVWLDGAPTVTTSPADAPGIGITSTATNKANCVSGSLPLSFSSDDVGDGLVSGSATVMVLPQDRTASPVKVSVTFTADMQRPINPWYFLLALVGLTLLGVAVPVALLYLAKFVTAKIPGTSLSAGSVRGEVSAGSGSFLDAGCSLTPQQLLSQPLPQGGSRRVSIDGKTLMTKAGLGLTEPGYVRVEHPGRISAAGPTGAQSKGHARLPLAVQNQWCVALDPTNPRGGEVEVTFFTVTGAPGWDTLVSGARRALPEVVRGLRSQIPESTPDAGDDTGIPADPWASSRVPAGTGADPWAQPANPNGPVFGAPIGGVPAAPVGAPPVPGVPPVTAPLDPWGGAPVAAPRQGDPDPDSSPQPPSGW
ncbi:hypothetical protein BA895_19940 [Humibacillus sp. DSM 29435]|uniref:vWA domain-containing protein n=1 Tax=Humibacillus sp. DSM 29435 TaxID=1869167 RepID=UPI000893DD12|nr:VWA domain-containing protein [Humibacillus sp. DSM 29435]OFE16163.1 hypothetical protein BA895_19940 [Humibacillus sp. DSM 29435]